MPKGALYYPYTTIQDVNWLKGNLILFDSMSRMLPPEYRVGLNDDYLLTDFENVGLLVRANLFSRRSLKAQDAPEWHVDVLELVPKRDSTSDVSRQVTRNGAPSGATLGAGS
jgi:hypothetical protein